MLSSILLLLVTFLLVSFIAVYVLKYSFGDNPSRSFGVALTVVVLLALGYYTYLFLCCPKTATLSYHHGYNLAGLFLLFFFMQVLRAFLDQLDIRARTGKCDFTGIALLKNSGDMLIEFTVFGAIYVMIAYSSVYEDKHTIFASIGYLLSALCVVKILKYRIYDDLYKRWLHIGGSYLGSTTSAPTTLLQGIFNVLFRAYLTIALSFACVYLLLYFGPLILDGKKSFAVTNQSGNLFVDFVYFSIITMSTVGYGDISPVGIIPKLLCAFQILLGYFFVGTTFAYVFYVIGIRPPTSPHPKEKESGVS